MSEFTTHPGKDGVDGGDSAPGDNLELENELLEQSLGIAELAAERDRYLDQLQRTAAEFANYRRRTEQSLIQDRKNAARDLMVQIAPIMDDFERALANAPQDESQHVWVEGVRLIERKLAGLLERQDVRKIEALGQPFDPAVHEAVAQDPDNTDNVVVEVYQNGYTIGDQLLRPVMVRVGNMPKAN